MNQKSVFFLFGLSALLMLNACKKDDTGATSYTGGILVLNEGNFLSSNASVSFLDAGGNITNNIFGLANNNLILGDVAQSIDIENGKAYIVLNNSNKLVIADAETFVYDTVVENLTLPRQVLVEGNYAYISQYVSYSGNGNLIKIDLSTYTVAGTATLGYLPDRFIIENGKAFVTNSSDATVSVVDINTMNTLASIQVGDWPNSLVVFNGSLYVLAGGVPSFAGTQTTGKIMKVDMASYAVTEEYNFNDTTFHPNLLIHAGTKMLFHNSGGIYAYSPAMTYVNTPVISRYAYGLAYSSSLQRIYVSDAGSFLSGSNIIWFDGSTYAALDSATAEIGANNFFFN